MAWTDPRTWVTSELVTAAIMNTHIRDNAKELWREIVKVDAGSQVATPGNAGLYGINAGTVYVSLGSIVFSGRPGLIEVQIPIIYESGTADISSAWVLAITDGTPGTTEGAGGKIIGRSVGNAGGAASGSGLFTWRNTFTGTHTYNVACWSGNGTGSDSVVIAAGGYVRYLERGG